MLLLLISLYAPGILNRAIRKTYSLDTTGLEYKLFNLSTTEPIKTQIEAGNNTMKIYNISSNDTEEFVRGLYLKLLKASDGLHAYFCSMEHGIQNTSSICGDYFYEELQFPSAKEILRKRGY